MSKVNIFSKDLNRMSREPIGGLSIKQIRQQVIEYLQGKQTVCVDYRKIRAEANKVYHQKVARITFDENGWYMVCDKDLEYAIVNTLIGKMFNETWFLTQSEAEEKLKELRGKENDGMEP